jgi:hypothetical protein
MPGLLRGMARTAVIAGTATHVSNNVSRRQSQRWAAQEQEQAPQAAAAPQSNTDAQIEQLQQLGQLRDQGVLTDQEFAAKKSEILGF